jgi:Glycosyl hydrolase family 92
VRWDFILSTPYQENMSLDRTKWFHLLFNFFFFDIPSFCRPFFERISINLSPYPSNTPKKLTITAIGARSKPYIKSLVINGISITQPIIKHEQIANGAEVVFEMSDEIEIWGNDESVLKALGVGLHSGVSLSSSKLDGVYVHNEL